LSYHFGPCGRGQGPGRPTRLGLREIFRAPCRKNDFSEKVLDLLEDIDNVEDFNNLHSISGSTAQQDERHIV